MTVDHSKGLTPADVALIERVVPASLRVYFTGVRVAEAAAALLNAARLEGAKSAPEGWSEDQGNHDCLAKRRPGEPMFILLGRDPDAHHLVRLWAKRRFIAGGDVEHCSQGVTTANRMQAYAGDPANRPASAPPADAYPPVSHISDGMVEADDYVALANRGLGKVYNENQALLEALKPFAEVSAKAKGADDACWCGQDGAVIRYRDLRLAAKLYAGFRAQEASEWGGRKPSSQDLVDGYYGLTVSEASAIRERLGLPDPAPGLNDAQQRALDLDAAKNAGKLLSVWTEIQAYRDSSGRGA